MVQNIDAGKVEAERRRMQEGMLEDGSDTEDEAGEPRVRLPGGKKMTKLRLNQSLWWDAHDGLMERMKVAMSLGGDVNFWYESVNMAPMYGAAANGHADVVRVLAEAGANVEQPEKDSMSNGHLLLRTPLMATALGGTALHRATAEALMDYGANLNNTDGSGRTATHLAAMYGHDEYLGWLVRQKHMDFELKDTGGHTPLMAAAANGHYKCVELLLKADAKVDSVNNLGWSANFLAMKNEHIECSKLLVHGGADMEADLEMSKKYIAAMAAKDAKLVNQTMEDVSAGRPVNAGVKTCLACNTKGEELARCGRCKAAWFCDRDCQRKAWPSHKGECEPV